ncbi:response regulator transcription factor [Listeria monocytogenes]|nr:response regulator transcription factor [Listeria monocytogenes]
MLVVEDDKAIRKLITTTLETRNYNFYTADTGNAALIQVTSRQPDIIILDLGLPDMDGTTIIQRVREWSQVPIIVVSARSEDSDKIVALDMGADDFLTKPFSVEELLARIRVSLRRRAYTNSELSTQNVFINGDLKINYTLRAVYLAEIEIHLTPIEYKLVSLLAKNVGRVLTHNYITHQIWGDYSNDIPALRVFMANLRKKIEKKSAQQRYIQTHVGIGYRMLQVSDNKENETI